MFSIDDKDETIIKLEKELFNVALFTDLEIMEFNIYGNEEHLVFDLAAQNTGNIFHYCHNLIDDTYVLIGTPCLYTWKDSNKREIEPELLKRLFDYSRNKSSQSLMLKK